MKREVKTFNDLNGVDLEYALQEFEQLGNIKVYIRTNIEYGTGCASCPVYIGTLYEALNTQEKYFNYLITRIDIGYIEVCGLTQIIDLQFCIEEDK